MHVCYCAYFALPCGTVFSRYVMKTKETVFSQLYGKTPSHPLTLKSWSISMGAQKLNEFHSIEF